MPDFIKVAYVAGAHGIKGEVKLRVYLEDPNTLRKLSPLTSEDGAITYTPRFTGKSGEQLIARFEGMDSREAAEALKGTSLYVPRTSMPQTRGNEWYASELVGMSVVSPRGDVLGEIASVQNYGGGDIIEITQSNGESVLYPFRKETIINVDSALRVITLEPPEMV